MITRRWHQMSTGFLTGAALLLTTALVTQAGETAISTVKPMVPTHATAQATGLAAQEGEALARAKKAKAVFMAPLACDLNGDGYLDDSTGAVQISKQGTATITVQDLAPETAYLVGLSCQGDWANVVEVGTTSANGTLRITVPELVNVPCAAPAVGVADSDGTLGHFCLTTLQ